MSFGGQASQNLSTFDMQLDNVYESLVPLAEAGYRTDALLYPTFLYNATAEGGDKDPLRRANSILHHLLAFFQKKGETGMENGATAVGLFLEVQNILTTLIMLLNLVAIRADLFEWHNDATEGSSMLDLGLPPLDTPHDGHQLQQASRFVDGCGHRNCSQKGLSVGIDWGAIP